MERKWWHGKTAYQIYPKSFCDSDGDGIGDLQGIISKLDYLQELGVEIVWLSPVYRSPLVDQGYDISDYYSIDPRFGSMADMDELIARARERGISIVMDLVVNHCSDEHEWFRRACQDPEGPYGQFFYIRDWHKGEPLPCNWRSYFGGPCWDLLPGHTDKIYFHAFHKRQPDLNWENPALRREIYKMINWWLQKGLGGFRIDAIINIKKLLPFRDFPADRDDGLCAIQTMLARAEGVKDFLQELVRETFRRYDAFTVGRSLTRSRRICPRSSARTAFFPACSTSPRSCSARTGGAGISAGGPRRRNIKRRPSPLRPRPQTSVFTPTSSKTTTSPGACPTICLRGNAPTRRKSCWAVSTSCCGACPSCIRAKSWGWPTWRGLPSNATTI